MRAFTGHRPSSWDLACPDAHHLCGEEAWICRDRSSSACIDVTGDRHSGRSAFQPIVREGVRWPKASSVETAKGRSPRKRSRKRLPLRHQRRASRSRNRRESAYPRRRRSRSQACIWARGRSRPAGWRVRRSRMRRYGGRVHDLDPVRLIEGDCVGCAANTGAGELLRSGARSASRQAKRTPLLGQAKLITACTQPNAALPAANRSSDAIRNCWTNSTGALSTCGTEARRSRTTGGSARWRDASWPACVGTFDR